MAIQGKFLKLFNVWGSCKNVLGNTNRFLPGFQQVAYLRQESVEEKFNIPPKPKRPLTPYFKFMNNIRPEIQKENPKGKLTEFVKEAALRWAKVEPQVKQKMEEEYRKEQEVYIREKLDFETNLTEEQKSALKEAKHARSEDRQKRKYRKKCKENNKPKKPCSAYVLYLKTQLTNRGTENFREWQKALAKKWNAMTEEEKKPFMEEMKDGYKEYQLKMTAWERDMIKMGNLDIVRQDALVDPKPMKAKPKPKKTE